MWYHGDKSVLWQVADTTSVEGEPRDKVCEVVDAPASFKSDACNHFVLPVLRNVERSDSQTKKQNADTAGQYHQNTKFKVQLFKKH